MSFFFKALMLPLACVGTALAEPAGAVGMVEAYVCRITKEIAEGKVLDNSHFVLMSMASVVYSQGGYLDMSAPLTEVEYHRWLKSPALYGAMFYRHRDLFLGNWSYEIKLIEDGMAAVVTGRDGARELQLFLVRCGVPGMPAFAIDVAESSYNGKPLPRVFGFRYKENPRAQEPVPTGVSKELLQELIRIGS